MTDRLFLDLQAALAGRYSLISELGRGGMAVVYLAREVRLDRLVAIKLLPPVLAGTADMRERFLREARTAARLTHPHIIPVYAADEAGDFAFFAMAYVKGETLAARVARLGPRPADEVARITRQAAFALAYAHAQGVIHRDIKPENILLEGDNQHVMLADFGIAQTSESDTDPGRRIGTPLWMAPEQLAGAPVDARADLYALGQVARFALTGAAARYPVAPLPARLGAIIGKASALVPADRFASAEEMATSLEALGNRERIAPQLERWIASGEAIRPTDALLSPLLLAPMTVLFELMFDGLLSGNAGGYDQTVALVVSLLAPITIWAGLRVADTRRALRAGFTRRDLIRALDTRARALDEQAAEDGALAPRGQAVRSVLAGGIVAGAWGLSQLMAANTGGDIVALVAAGYTLFAGVLAAWRFGRSGKAPSSQTGTDLRARFWNSGWGRLMEKLASWRLRSSPSREALLAQPTEVGLAAVADRMFEGLDAARRAKLAEVPELVRRLEARASAAREAGDERELADSVTALENIRLDLMRLAAGTGEGLTKDLDEARRIGERVDAIT